jgi:type I restriction enzyme S subunit
MEQIKKGYKKTEVGVIPADWMSLQITDLIERKFITGHLDGNHGALYPKTSEFANYGVPYITANDFAEGKVDYSNIRYLPIERALRFQKGFAKNGDVLFAHNATIGPTAILNTALDFVILSTTATYFRTDKNKLVNTYLKSFFESSLFTRQYSAVMRQSTRNQIPITAQRKFFVAIPPTLTEQKAIATALSDVDELINNLEKLIAKKKAIKQGAMQALLTPPHKGGKRLDGFSGEWKEVRLGEIGNTYGGLSGKKKSDFENGHYSYITFLNVMNNTIISTREFGMVLVEANEKQNLAKKGDLFFNTSSETPEEVGMCAVLMDDVPNLYLNSFCFGFRLFDTTKVDGLFLSYYFNSSIGRQHFLSLAQGATRYNLSKSNLSRIKFFMPHVKEQKEIASILYNIDLELEMLNKKLLKSQYLKQGMMQELLTGKTRLV